MDWHSLPPLTALRAFAALAETGSVNEAGEKLNVSHAAISQQVKALEAHMGISLVDRSGRSLALTHEGQELAEALSVGFGAIARTVEALTGADADRPLQISTTQLFAVSWLMPRLKDFQDRHPEIDLMINPTPDVVDLAACGIDVALRFGTGDWPGLDSEMLVPTDVVVVASPDLVGDADITDPSALLDYPWLQEPGREEAADWLYSHGVTEGRVKRMTIVPGSLLLDGARGGQGMIVATTSTVEADIASGRLRVLFRDKGDTGYFMVTRPGVLRPPAKAFVSWLRRQAKTAADVK